MMRAASATLGVAVLLLAPATASAGAAGNTVIVKYATGAATTSRQAAADRAGVRENVGTVAAVGAQVVRVSGDPAAAAATLNRSATVDYAEPNFEMHALATPNDARFGELYGLNNTGQTGGLADADIDAPEAWDIYPGPSFPATGGVKVGIVDTGIDGNHEYLRGRTVNCASASLLTGRVTEGSCTDASVDDLGTPGRDTSYGFGRVNAAKAVQ